jgi:hypothetical protein
MMPGRSALLLTETVKVVRDVLHPVYIKANVHYRNVNQLLKVLNGCGTSLYIFSNCISKIIRSSNHQLLLENILKISFCGRYAPSSKERGALKPGNFDRFWKVHSFLKTILWDSDSQYAITTQHKRDAVRVSSLFDIDYYEWCKS